MRFCRAIVRKYLPEIDTNPSKIRGFRSFVGAKSGRRDILKEYQVKLDSPYRGIFASHCRVRPAGNSRTEDWILKYLLPAVLCILLFGTPMSAQPLHEMEVIGFAYTKAMSERVRPRAAGRFDKVIALLAEFFPLFLRWFEEDEEPLDPSAAHLAKVERDLSGECLQAYWDWRNNADMRYYSSFTYSTEVCAYSLNRGAKFLADKEALDKCGPTCKEIVWYYSPD